MLGTGKPRNNSRAASGSLARTIKEGRVALGLTQQSFGILTGVGLKAIRTLEQGGYSLAFDKVKQVIDFLGLELVALPRDEVQLYREWYAAKKGK